MTEPSTLRTSATGVAVRVRLRRLAFTLLALGYVFAAHVQHALAGTFTAKIKDVHCGDGNFFNGDCTNSGLMILLCNAECSYYDPSAYATGFTACFDTDVRNTHGCNSPNWYETLSASCSCYSPTFSSPCGEAGSPCSQNSQCCNDACEPGNDICGEIG